LNYTKKHTTKSHETITLKSAKIFVQTGKSAGLFKKCVRAVDNIEHGSVLAYILHISYIFIKFKAKILMTSMTTVYRS
jgi:hypothetical protein